MTKCGGGGFLLNPAEYVWNHADQALANARRRGTASAVAAVRRSENPRLAKTPVVVFLRV